MVEKKYEIDSVRMSFEDLDNILNAVRSLTKKANEGVGVKKTKERISLSHQGHSVTLKEWELLRNESSIPDYVTGVWYWYEAGYNSPISEVQINLENNYSKITIKGENRNQVEAVSAVLTDKLEEHSYFIAESSFKIACGLASIIFGSFLVILRKNNKIVPSVVILGIFFLLVPSVFPWGDWLPTVAIFNGESGFIDRNVNLISVLGVLLALVSLIVPVIRSVYTKN